MESRGGNCKAAKPRGITEYQISTAESEKQGEPGNVWHHAIRSGFSLFGAPGGARFLPVKVRNPPGSGKDIAEGKGVHHEVESEGSRIRGTY